MAQHDYIIANQSGAAFRADLNNALAAIVSQNSGAAEPSVTYAYQPWADTTTGLFKIRNAANSAWITLYQLDGEWSTIALENGTAAAPSLYFKDSGTDTGVYSPGPDQVAIATASVQRVNFNGATEVVFNDGGADVDFRIEGDTEENLLLVDAGNDLVRIGGKYNILKGFNRRPPVHRGPLFYKTAAATLSVVANSALNGFFYDTATAVSMPSHSNNTDYAIWQHPTTGALVADASFTSAPAGASGGSIVGGYHYIPSGRPTAVNNGSPTAAAEILEYSIWDLTWRPSCPDPRGMACIDERFWCDLYLCGSTSYAGTDFTAVPSSKIGLTIADGNNPPLIPAIYGGDGATAYSLVDSKGAGSWYDFAEVASSFGKRLISWLEFQHAAFGGPENGSRGADPGTVIWERASLWGLAQSTGTLYSWGADVQGNTGGGWTSATGDRGDVYQSGYSAVVLGGNWGNGSVSGSRCAAWLDAPSLANSALSARFAAGHLVTC